MPRQLLRSDARELAAKALEHHRPALVWAGILTALTTVVPLIIGAVAALGPGAVPLPATQLESEEALQALGGVLASAGLRALGSIGFLLLLALPLSYGAAYIGVRAVRDERTRAADLLLPFRRPIAFGGFGLLLIASGLIPLIAWIVAAVAVGVVVTLALFGTTPDPADMMLPMLWTVMLVGVPFIFISIYFQFRLVFGGIAAIDPSCGRLGGWASTVLSWRLTRGQNLPLSWVAWDALVAVGASLFRDFGLGIVTRGLPEFVALFCASYELLLRRVQAQSTSRHGSQ
ncbi:MAG: hypothetical protein EBR10_03835 [Planctomycetes bacterium]|nr:hypothetical protein [Planctomycetota bacterium]